MAHALQTNTTLTSFTLEEVPLVNTHGGRRNAAAAAAAAALYYYQPQPQLFALGKSLASHPHLKRLALVEYGLGNTGSTALMQVWSLLEQSATTSRHGFWVASPPLSNSSTTTLLPTPPTPTQTSGSSLQSLSLGTNNIGDQKVFWILQAFLKQSLSFQLSELDCSSNLISHEGAASLSNLIRKSKQLSTLLLSGNTIGPQGAEHLAQALLPQPQENNSPQKMTILGLSSNDMIQDQGAVAMAIAASHHPSLQTILLKDKRQSHWKTGMSAVVHRPIRPTLDWECYEWKKPTNANLRMKGEPTTAK
jgi:hypothetical protein